MDTKQNKKKDGKKDGKKKNGSKTSQTKTSRGPCPALEPRDGGAHQHGQVAARRGEMFATERSEVDFVGEKNGGNYCLNDLCLSNLVELHTVFLRNHW